MKEKKSQVAVIDFTKFDIQQLPELHGKKEEIKKVIEANPVVKITDNASYELAKKSRTAVKTLRTSLEKGFLRSKTALLNNPKHYSKIYFDNLTYIPKK